MVGLLLEGPVPGAVTWLGTLLGLAGIYLTYQQAKAARTAAGQAKVAVANLNVRIGLSRIGVATSQLDTLRVVVDASHFAVAASLVSPLRRSIHQISAAMEGGGGTGREMPSVMRSLAAIDRQLALAATSSGAYKSTVIIKAMGGIDEHLSAAEVALLKSTELDDAKSG